ncbi:MAG: hypothetical protein R6V14_01005 [Halanaerobiales bacterium]
MPDWEFYKYALIVSIISVVLIAVLSPQYLWPWAITIFVLQLIAVFISDWLVTMVRTKYTKSRYLAPGFVLYRRYFGFALTLYLIMGVFGVIEGKAAKLFFSLFVLGIMGIGLSLVLRIMVAGNLLDRFKDEKNKEDRE